MKRIVYKYRVSKFKRFTEGLLFAVISAIAFALCLAGISSGAAQEDIIVPFCFGGISMLMGFVSMFRRNELPKAN
jgi:hypothetical protein